MNRFTTEGTWTAEHARAVREALAQLPDGHVAKELLNERARHECAPVRIHDLRDAILQMAGEQLADESGGAPPDRIGYIERTLGNNVCRQLGIYRVPDDLRLSVVIPVFNEATTIERVVARVRDAEPNAQIVVVDDGSSDGTGEVLERIQQQHAESQGKLTVVRHEVNRGKGAALRTGFAHVTGDVVVVQDADMEYDPREFRLLLQPIVEGTADVVYGSRFAHGQPPTSPWWHRAANGLITRLSNVRTGLRFSDVETCYKVFRRELIDRLVGDLREDRFGIELEITAKLARMKDVRFCERPISYAHRSYAEGKKIGWRDGISALRCILRY